MRQWLVVGLLLVMIGLLLGGAAGGGSASSDVPPGIDPSGWHPLTDRLGLAVRQERGVAGQPEVVGTLMLKEGNHWITVHLEPPSPRLKPAQ
jgi:hypothetical protein